MPLTRDYLDNRFYEVYDMNKLELYTCKRGHLNVTEECPFCCAIDKVEPQGNNSTVLQIYSLIKGKNEEEIEIIYNSNYLPTEPELCKDNKEDLFR